MMPSNRSSSASTRNAITELTSLGQYNSLRNHRMRFQDALDINAERVNSTNKQDIIFGRGKSLQDHPGNQRMRKITNKYKNLYRTLLRSQKRDLVESVYKEIVCNGARFLTKAPSATHYLLVDVEVALQKISNSLRCMKEHKRQLIAATECRNASAETVPNAPLSVAAAPSLILQRASVQIHPWAFNDQRAFPRKLCDSLQSEPAPSPNPNVTAGSKNILDGYATLQPCRHLRLIADLCMKPSIAIGASVKVLSSVQPSKEAPDSKSNRQP